VNKLNYDSEGNYHDDDIRLESYSESADRLVPDIEGKDYFVDQVVNSIQKEIGEQLKFNPDKTINDIKLMAMHRFLDLINNGLLKPEEANKCYQRFSQMLSYYYGS
jgi:hypothetical protein